MKVGAMDLPYLRGAAWSIAGVMASTGPLVQWLAPPPSGLHSYLWNTVFLVPSLTLAGAVGNSRPRWAYGLTIIGSFAASVAVTITSTGPVPGGLIRPAVALPFWIAAALLPYPRIVAALAASSLALTAWVGRSGDPALLVPGLIAHVAAAALAVGIAYGWRQGRLAALDVGRLEAAVQHQKAQKAAMARFLHRAAHELRTPLAPLTLLPATLERTTDPEGRAVHLEKMKEKLRQITRTLDRMARLAAVEEAGTEGRSDVVGQLKALADDDIRLIAPEEAMVAIQWEALEVVLKELIQNAQAAGTEVCVTVEEAGDAWQIHVDDDGAGIPEKDREALMEPFGRVELDLPPQRGTGLGLAIAQAITLNAGGDLRLARSDLGGLRASLTLPK